MGKQFKYLTNFKVQLFVLLFVAILSVNGWSFWGDELSTAMLASLDTIPDLLDRLQNWAGSESQMPLFVISIWSWAKCFGISEIALRSFNIFIILLFLSYCLYVMQQLNSYEQKILKVSLWIAIVSPFILYNINEARVNISLFAFAYICFISLYVGIKYQNHKHFYICLISLCLGYAFNMLFAFIVPSLLIMAFFLDKKLFFSRWKSLLAGIVICIFISLYYIWTINNGKGGAIENPGIKNIAFSLYQFLGFEGMGPDKNTIRLSANLLSTIHPYIITLLIFILSYLCLLSNLYNIKKNNKILCLLAVSFSIFFLGAYLAHFRFWGRHIIIFYPLWCLSLAIYIVRIWNNSNIGKASVVFFTFAVVVSSVRTVFFDCYKKENIKGTIAYINKINTKGLGVFYDGVTYQVDGYIINHQQDFKNLKSSSSGYFVYMKNMAIFNKTNYNSENPHYKSASFNYRVLKDNKDAIVYYFTPKR